MQNSIQSRFKRSKLEIQTGYCVYMTFTIQIVLCLFASVTSLLRENGNRGFIAGVLLFMIRFGNWILIFGLANKKLCPHIPFGDFRDRQVLPGFAYLQGEDDAHAGKGRGR